MSVMRRVMPLGSAIALTFFATFPLPLFAGDGPPGPDGLPPTTRKHPWRIFAGEPRIDTLSFAPRDVVPAARKQLEADRWVIYSLDANRGEIVTKWKAMHHPLLWLFMGGVRARCTVELSPVGPDRTRMVFRGDLVSHRDLTHNPMLGAARKAYAKAASNYRGELSAYLRDHARLSRLGP